VQLELNHSIGGRSTEYPAAVISNLTVLAPNGQTHRRLWEGVIDTGADCSILPNEILDELHLIDLRQRVRIWTYRKDEPPRELDVYYVKLGLAPGLVVLTKAITSERKNVLIGRCALLKTSLTINWQANWWSLEQASTVAGPRDSNS